jgi:hypothetical protein
MAYSIWLMAYSLWCIVYGVWPPAKNHHLNVALKELIEKYRVLQIGKPSLLLRLYAISHMPYAILLRRHREFFLHRLLPRTLDR